MAVPIPEVFSNSKLWVRLVDKRGRMKTLLDTSLNGDRKSTEALGAIFREELAGYGSFYFNTANEKSATYWQVRNRLNPILNSILFIPSIKLTIENNAAEGDNITFQNSVDLTLKEIIPSNSNINESQIGNLQKVLDKIKNTQQYPLKHQDLKNTQQYPLKHQDLKNIIRINSFDVKWITQDFLTQEATLEIYFEHFQLLKTQMAKELMRPNKRIKVETKFYNLFADSEYKIGNLDFDTFVRNLSGGELPITYAEYKEFIDASNENENTDWVIYNFDTAFDDNDGVMLSVKLVKHAIPVLQQKSFQNIKPINLLTKEIIDYFNDIEILKISGSEKKSQNSIFVPSISFDNKFNSKSRNSNLNLTKTTYMVIDAGRFIMYLLWLYAVKYKEYFDETEGVVNKKKMSNNFLVTFEMDVTPPNKTKNLKERYNGCLMSYVDVSWRSPRYKSIGLFDFDKTSTLFENQKYTDVAFNFFSNDNKNGEFDVYKWKLSPSSGEFASSKLSINGFGDMPGSFVYSSLLAESVQENFIEQESVSAMRSDAVAQNSVATVAMGEVGLFFVGNQWITEATVDAHAALEAQEAERKYQTIYLPKFDDEQFQEAIDLIPNPVKVKPDIGYDSFLYLSSWKEKADFVDSHEGSPPGVSFSNWNRLTKDRWRAAYQRKMDKEEAKKAEEAKALSDAKDLVLIKNANSYYSFPMSKMAVSDDYWLGEFDKTVGEFVRNELSCIFDNRKNALAHFNNNKNDNNIQTSDSVILDGGSFKTKEPNINSLPWKQRQRRLSWNVQEIYDNSEFETPSVDKYESKIYEQISNYESLKVATIPRRPDSKIDNSTKEFAKIHILNNTEFEDWLEIRISDTDNFILNDVEQKIYAQIQLDVFNDIDKNNMIKMNQIADNNVISFKSSSETVSDAPYALGVFNPHVVGEDDYVTKVQNIRKVLGGISTISDEDKAKIDNSLAFMKLIIKSGTQRTETIRNIVNWAVDKKPSLDDKSLYNSISGSFFLNNISDVGTKERLMTTLYDLLYYEIQVDSWYVPTFAPFTPFFLFTGGEKTLDLFAKFANNPEYQLDGNEPAFLHNRISPQSGMYYITEMGYKIDDSGSWTQTWKGRKRDYGFMNSIFKQLFSSKDDAYLEANVNTNDNRDHFSSMNFVLQPESYQENSAFDVVKLPYGLNDNNMAVNQILQAGVLARYDNMIDNSWLKDISSLFFHKNIFENDSLGLSYLTNDIIKDSYNLVYLYNFIFKCNELQQNFTYPNNNSLLGIDLKSISKKQNIWLNYNTELPAYYQFVTNNNIQKPSALKYLKGNEWFKYHSLKFYNFAPEVFTVLNQEVCPADVWKNKAEPLEKVFTNEDAYISREKIIGSNILYTYDDLKNNISNFNIDCGTMITIQRNDHPSINPYQLTPAYIENEEFSIDEISIKDEQLLTCDAFKVKGKLYENNGWRTIEKYLILDSSIMFQFFNSFNISSVVNYPTETKLINWDDYSYKCSSEEGDWYNYLLRNGITLNKDSRNDDTMSYIRKSFIRYAWNFIMNFVDTYDTKEIGIAGSSGQYTAKYVEKQVINNVYTDLVSSGDYKTYIDDFWETYWNPIFNQFYGKYVLDPIKQKIESSSLSSGSEDSVKSKIKEMVFENKKEFSVQILNGKFQEFLTQWYNNTVVNYLSDIKTLKSWTDTGRLFPFDLLLGNVVSDDKLKSTRFSAIRWRYDEKRKQQENMFGGEFVGNMSFDQLCFKLNRNENYLEEVFGEKVIRKTPTIQRFYNTQTELDDHNKKYEKKIIYDYSSKNNQTEPRKYFEEKYGDIRIIINDKWTSKLLTT